ncbi:MAG: tRNA (N(6)-L-threonylcarbamoyladenosine(37)-C(2))-methylthiotransferase MtaB [Desulfobacteraceae bacterium]
MAFSFTIITLGCKVNQYESAWLDQTLRQAGGTPSEAGASSDVVIVNTCIVTRRASHQSRQAIRKAIRENKNATIAAVGCYAQTFPEELTAIEGVHLIADNRTKGQVPRMLLNGVSKQQQVLSLKPFEPHAPFDFLRISTFPSRARAYLKIQDGCRSFCSYCIVPYTRGPYRSLAPEAVVSVLHDLSAQGFKEVVLTGIHLGKYGVDLKGEIHLTALLEAVGKARLPLRIRLSSLEPNELDRGLIERIAHEPWLCRHFHIPLQSGDDRILRRMNRGFTRAAFARLIETIHAESPSAAIGVDVMAGFPGEDEPAHQNTYALLRDLPISYLHVFPFSPRPGTPAASFADPVDPKTIKMRAAQLRELGQGKRLLFYNSCLAQGFDVLTETWHNVQEKLIRGTSDNYLPVIFPSESIHPGSIVPVHIDRVRENGVNGHVSREGVPW